MEITKQALDIHQDTSREQFRFDMKGDEDVYMQYHIHTVLTRMFWRLKKPMSRKYSAA
jgi:hypothetical protein